LLDGYFVVARTKRPTAEAAESLDELRDLPQGWTWKPLSDFSDEPRRGEPSSKFKDTFSYLDVSSIDGRNLSPRTIDAKGAPSRARQFLQKGDTVISGVRVYLRNFALIEEGGPDVASTAFCVLRPKAGIDPKFLFYWVSRDQFIQQLLPLQRGNSPPAVLDADIREQPIAVPPLAAQARIVVRIKELFAEIDDGERAFAEARDGLDTYRKSLLNAAVTGELTAEWRAQNCHAPSRQWMNCKLGDHCKVKGGYAFKSSDYSENGTTLIRIGDIHAPMFSATDHTARLPSAFMSSYSNFVVRDGDIVVAMSGATTGKYGIYVGPPALLNQRVGKFAISSSELSSNFLQLWLGTRQQLILQTAYGGAQPNISNRDIEAMRLKLPPLDEQREIAERAEAGLGIADGLAVQVEEQAVRANNLRQSILSTAFRGGLFP
jgi:type I restriction enzyme S subunit